MEALIEFGKLLIPAAVVLYAMYLTVKSFLNRETENRLLDIKAKSAEVAVPIRLQAFERICLLLERMSPQNLVVRLNTGKFTAVEFHQILLSDIREEFNHNVSQQVYMGDATWELVKNAKEDLIIAVNEAATSLPADASSIDLAKNLIEGFMNKENDPIALALAAVKGEIRTIF